MSSLTRARILIRGAVQGVGFRPFVHRLATELALSGWVSNSSEGVFIEVEGAKSTVEEFVLRVGKEHPRHASIHGLEYSFLDPAGFRNFEIRQSDVKGAKQVLMLPDIATCSDCLHEISDPANRRYHYPFTNCTNCGPRFTIIESLPYDRANTTMRHFQMCARCRSEYANPLDRRFHAQPNACPDCGPHLEMWDPAGSVIARFEDAVASAVEALKSGRIVAVKGLGGFHLMVDAQNENAVLRLRWLKHREEKPFALMAPSLESAREICDVNALEERALLSPECPIVLLSKRASATIPPTVAPNNPYLGVMLPYTPLHHILMREMGSPIVATSGNRSDEPIAIDERDALRRLSGIADLFLVHNRPIRRHADDSIVRIILGREQVLRRARGYAPLPVRGKGAELSAPGLAVGAHMKNTVALNTGTNIFVSQHIGDLQAEEAFDAFREVIDDFETMYEPDLQYVTGDMHPDYASTAYGSALAETRGIPYLRVQHHWAHMLSCMTENAVKAPALGIVWDGTGYGLDGTIWGGEFLLTTDEGFRRAAHFRTFPLPGGDAAIRKPYHAAAGVLYEIFGDDAFTGRESSLLRQMLAKGIRSPRTSSVGRLFDAVASIAGVRDQVSFEGQAAMELEFALQPNVTESYDYGIRPGESLIVDWEPMICDIVRDARNNVECGIISSRFHNTLVSIVIDIAHRIGEPRVVLTGGCFQNRYLTEQTVRRLSEEGFSVYWHQRIPPNDGGIALGQVIAASTMQRQESLCVLQSQAK